MFNRRQAQEWRESCRTAVFSEANRGNSPLVYYQEQVAQRVKSAVFDLGKAGGHLLTRRPFQSLWFSSQISLCIELWNYDHQTIQALDLAKSLLIPLETHDALCPCAGEGLVVRGQHS